MLELVECPHCSTRVLPMAGRVCPACRGNVDEPPAPAGRTADDPYDFAAEQMRYGVDPSGIEQSLTDRGLDVGEAATVVHRLEQARTEARKQEGRKNMRVGALLCCAGIGLTALTYRAAMNAGGGRMMFAWGAILFGAIQFVRGLIQSAEE